MNQPGPRGASVGVAYGDVGDLFRWHWVLPTMNTYILWIPAYFTPLILLAVAGPWARGLIRPARMALAACVARGKSCRFKNESKP